MEGGLINLIALIRTGAVKGVTSAMGGGAQDPKPKAAGVKGPPRPVQ